MPADPDRLPAEAQGVFAVEPFRDEATEIARRQVKGGAQIIDVCLQSTEGDEKAAVRELYDRIGRAVKVPVMIEVTLNRMVSTRVCSGSPRVVS